MITLLDLNPFQATSKRGFCFAADNDHRRDLMLPVVGARSAAGRARQADPLPHDFHQRFPATHAQHSGFGHRQHQIPSKDGAWILAEVGFLCSLLIGTQRLSSISDRYYLSQGDISNILRAGIQLFVSFHWRLRLSNYFYLSFRDISSQVKP